jgi:predicted phage tail protein
MGEVPHLEITGAKGGESKPKSPVEAPDSLQSTNIAKLLLAVGEGEFEGKPTDRDIYLDNTPIMDASGNVNFPGVKWEWRSGSVEQGYIQGIPAVENENSVGVELRSDSPFTRALSDTKLSAVRVRLSWPRLLSQDSNGNTNGYRIEYAIDIATDGGAYVEAHRGAVNGKSNNGYQRSVRVNLPNATSGWMLRVRRITPNANKGAIADTMTIAGYTEIIDEKLCYPNTALLYIEFDAQQFQNIPAVTVKCKAKRWPIPSNYDPIARTYTGIWDGTFKQAWTNNPAFVTYGLCVEDRFGLGKRIKPWMVDKWEMYRIAQYCDQRVPDGVGGTEPRFLCDMNLQGRSEAWVLLRDLSAIYRGMVYWAHGALFMQADMPRSQDIDYVFTRSNVVGGDFVYGGAERSSHYSRALVSYDNPANNYETDVIPSTDVSLQRRFRDRPIEISAIGCTRASEAQRRGKWALLSNSQDRTVTFRTGMEGRIPLPGYVIPVADELVAGRPNGGRISAAAGLVITLDRDTPIKAGDRLIVNLPNGTAQARTVKSVSGRAVTVTTAYSTQPEPQLQWAIDYQDLAVQLFRVLRTMRTDKGQYEITALEFNPSKFAAIDTGAKLDERPISVIPVTTVQPPASVTLASSYMIDQGIAVNTMTISWAAVAGAVAYEVEWRKDNGNWVRLQRTGATSIDVTGIYAGAYLAQVRAVSAYDISSTWKSSVLTQLNGKQGLPPSITSLTAESLLFGIGLTWAFPPGAEDTQRTELWYSAGTDLAKATKLADLAYPQDKHTLQGLRAGQRFYFWARLVDKSGNVGPWFPSGTTLVTGVSSADAGPILEQIQGQVTESAIGQKLNERIDLVDGTGPGSVTERVITASNAVKADVNKQLIQVNSTIDGVRSNLQGQITAVDGRVTTARDDLQKQISEVSSIAGALPYNKTKTYALDQAVLGANGKLYQAKKAVPVNAAPPNTDYWEDVGQSVRTANGTASAVSKLQMDVTTLGDTVTATSGKVDGFQASINTANSNASAAQGAAQAANDLAGGKGKVTVQNAAPAAADRLPQNLWIDTTNNANTPKRWNGSAWVSVSDKMATDAAAAAQNALNQVGSKADASAVNSLKLTVEQQGRDLTSQGSTLNGMQTTIDGKASSQALTQLSNRVKLTEDKNGLQDDTLKSQSESLTTLKDTVAKKADVSTVNQLANDVKTQGDTVSAQGSSLTKIEASLPGLAGENLLYNPSFERKASGDTGLADGWLQTGAGGTTRTPSLVPSQLAPAELAQRLDVSGLGAGVWIRLQSTDEKRASVSAGQAMTFSVYMRGTPGLLMRAELYFRKSDGSPADNGAGVLGQSVTANGSFQRVTVSGAAPADASICAVYPVAFGTATVTSGFIEADRAQLEAGEVATGWRDSGQVNAADALANASATTVLTGRVTKNEEGIKSTSELATKLSNSLVITNGNVDKAQGAAQAANDLAGGKGKVIVQNAAPAAADRLPQNLWIDTTNNANTPKRWSGSAWTAVTDKVATEAAAAAASALTEVAKKADASVVSAMKSTVDQHGRDITAQGLSLTRIDAGLGNLGASGINLVPAEYSQFARNPPPLAGTSFNASIAADAKAFKGFALKLDWINPSSGLAVHFAKDLTDAAANMAFRRQKYIISFYAKASVAGHQVAAYLRTYAPASGTTTVTGPTTGNLSLTTEWARYSALVDYTGANFSAQEMMILSFQMNRSGESGRAVWLDRIMVEAAVNDASVPSLFVAGTSFDQALANADATTALTARVVKTEDDLTTTAGQITSLNTSIGETGSENLLFNPSFEKKTQGNANLADGWTQAGAGGTTRTPSLVASQLAPSELAQRLDVTGLGRNIWVRLQPVDAKRVSVSAGQTLTFSVYMRGTPGLLIRAELYFRKSDGSAVNGGGFTGANFTATSSFQRIEVTAIVPADAASCDVYPVAFGIDSISTGFFEVDRAQLEQSSRATGWRDNGQVNAGDQSATAKAVDSLTSTTTKQGEKIESVSDRATFLENTINSPANGLGSKASTTALNQLGGRVTQTERDIYAAGGTLTDITSKLNGIGGTGSNLLPAQYSTFSEKLPGIHSAAQVTTTAQKDDSAYSGYLLKADSSAGTGWLYLADSAVNYTLRLVPGKRYIFSAWMKGSAAHNVAVRLRYQNTSGGATEVGLGSVDVSTTLARVSCVITAPGALAGPASLVFYTQNGSAAGTTWFDGIMLEEKVGDASAPSSFTPGNSANQMIAQANAVFALDTAVSKQGDKLTVTADSVTKLTGDLGKTNGNITDEARLRLEGDKAQATKTDRVQTNLDDTNGTVKTVSDAVVKLDGKVNTSFSVRLQASAGGTHYAAGFGIGLDNNAGTFQSSFVVKADRFVVMNPVGEGLITPFAIQNGQVFINDALISKLAVANAIVGVGLQSSAMTTWGGPVMTANFANGDVITRHPTRVNTYCVMNQNGIDVVVDGVRRVRMGVW